jgi:hypothetical protein
MSLTPYFQNGGMIGVTLDLGATDRYVIGETSGPATIEYVGGRTQGGAGTTGNITISLNGTLTGGLSSSPQDGDIVIVAIEMCGTTNKSYRISTYTQIADLYANDTEDSNLQVGYKFMSATPDTSVTITGGTGSTADAYAAIVHVWRGVDSTTPLDVTPTTASLTNTGIPNPPAITPTSTGAMIVVAAGTAHTGGIDTFGATYLDNFLTVGANDSNDATAGMGNIAWTSGSYDPAAWTFSQTNSTAFSTNSVTMALRPATVLVPEFGNLKNSGIWNIQAAYELLAPSGEAVPGQVAFTISDSWVVPVDVTSISAMCVGAGGGGGGSEDIDETGGGGGGGGLAYVNDIAVTPGETLTITVGTGGNGGGIGRNGAAGGTTFISRGATTLVSAGGGSGGVNRGAGGAGGGVTLGSGGTGGNGGNGSNRNTNNAGGGGGAGGYSGNGGKGGDHNSTTNATSGSGGGGGGGGGGTSNTARSGGGVGLQGEGTSGAAGTTNVSGGGGSGGASGTGSGGLYGGGGRGAAGEENSGGAGANGAARIIWGSDRAYPSTSTGDV